MFRMAGVTVEFKEDDARVYDAGEVVLEVTGTAGQLHCVYKAAQTVMEYASGISKGQPQSESRRDEKAFPWDKRDFVGKRRRRGRGDSSHRVVGLGVDL